MIKQFLHMKIFPQLILFTFVLACQGQTPVGRPKLKKTQGSNEYANIFCGLKDRAGDLWFGTGGEGVYRFDGKLFTQFTMKEGLNSNAIHCILQDRTGNIWFGTNEGLCRYDGKTIVTVPIDGGFLSALSSDDYYNATSKKNTVWSILQDRKGTIWVGRGDGVYCYDGKNFNRFLDNPGVVNNGHLQLRVVDCMFEDRNGFIWFASGCPPGEEGICRYDGKSVVSFKPKNEGWFRSIIEGPDGNLLFATRIHGVLACDLSAGNVSMASFSAFPQPKALLNNSLTAILKDKAGHIWMSSDYGNFVGDTLGGVWCYKLAAQAFSKITAKEVFFMLDDGAGNIWLATRNTGLYRYDGKTFTNFGE
jgi:ligand-binding sensor domain-containing protein